jgi:biopolymer transport protein TolR
MENLNKRKKLITEINMVPFTDVVLVLLIIFMVTTPFLFQGAFKVDLPKVTAPNPSLPESAILSVAPGGRLALDGRELRYEELTPSLAALYKEKPNVTLVLQADHGVSYGTVAAVLGQAYAAGLTKVGLAMEQDQQDAPIPLTENQTSEGGKTGG